MKQAIDSKLLSVDEIVVGKFEIREVVDDESMDELVDSIKNMGILLPLIVTNKRFGGYCLVAGHRRLHAAKRARLVKVPCRIMDIKDSMIDKIRYQENACRKNMTAVDEGEFFKKLRDELETKVVDIAQMAGKTAGYVSQRITLVEGDTRILDAVRSGRLGFAVARELQLIRSESQRMYYLRFAIDDGASVRTVQRWRVDANSASDLHDLLGPGGTEGAGESTAPESAPVLYPEEAEQLTCIPDSAGVFRCICGVVAHVSSSLETPDGFRCRVCMKEMRAAQADGHKVVDCPCCGRPLKDHGCIVISLCTDCNAEIEKIEAERKG